MPQGRCNRIVDRFRRHSALIVMVSLATGSGAWGQEDARTSSDGVWQSVDDAQALALRDVNAQPWVQPQTFHAVALDRDRLLVSLDGAPLEFTVAAREKPLVVTLPLPDGSFARFAVEEAPMMEAALAAKYPRIKTYRGRGLDDPHATVRFDWTPRGFHAQVLSPRGAVYIDPMWRDDTTLYAVYFKRDYRRAGAGFECLTRTERGPRDVDPPAGAIASGGTQVLRKYRLACAATGEYTQFHGATVGLGLAAIVTAINRVNGIYETELAVSMTLVANNADIVYTNGATDPYSNLDGFAMLGQNQSNLNSVIGSANYDIGHVFSTGGGGVAGLRVVCFGSQKARGVTGQPSPIGDPFQVDFVAHEMGHQFGGNHPFNGVLGNCAGGNRNGPTAYEPGSGATIMAYAGICGADNLQPNSDPYFLFISQQEMRSFVTGSGDFCASPVGTTNNFPTVNAGPDFVIPVETPFVLTASGSDPDLDPLTFTWEQRDLGPAQTLSAPDNGSSPLFRSFQGTNDPSRTFPRLTNILNGTSSLGERLPSTGRSLNFRVTARDNRPEGGAFATDDMTLTVHALAGPFRVTAPAFGDTWFDFENVLWDVANTNVAPVNTSDVNILLSIDGGLTFPITLASNAPNTGSAFVTIPGPSTTTARIKVEGAGNVFFGISDGDFSIISCDPDAPLAEPSPVDKSRYLSFDPNNVGLPAAYRITILDLPPPFEAFEGETRWAGPPSTLSDGVGGMFTASPGQCTPHFDGWFGASVVHVYGDFVVPGGVYGVQGVQCDVDTESDFSPTLFVSTGTWGDIIAPFGGGGQPDFADVSALVSSFSGESGAPTKPVAQLQPNVPDPAVAISFLDISLAVDAFSGNSFPFTGPTTCP